MEAKASFRYYTGQDIKSVWWMPWRQESMKDAVNCDKFRGAVSKH